MARYLTKCYKRLNITFVKNYCYFSKVFHLFLGIFCFLVVLVQAVALVAQVVVAAADEDAGMTVLGVAFV